MPTEFIQPVDFLNQPIIRKVTREQAHTKGIWNRTINFLIIDTQKRTVCFQSKKVFDPNNPKGFFLNINGGHLLFGETIEQASRELTEELGLNVDFEKQIFIGKYQISTQFSEDYLNNEFMYFYIVPEENVLEKISFGDGEVKTVVSFCPDEAIKLLDGEIDFIVGSFYDCKNEKPMVLDQSMFKNFTDDQFYKKLMLIASDYLNGVDSKRLVI